MRAIQVDGVDIEVTRKAIRSLRLRIRPPLAEVRLSIPWRATREDALRFVLSRREWIRRHRERILSVAGSANPANPPSDLTDGSVILLWGRERVLRLTSGRFHLDLPDSPDLGDDTLRLRLRDPSDASLCAKALERACRAILRDRMRSLAAAWSRVLGVAAPDLRVRNMKSRWGSCNPHRKRVWINLELVRRAPEFLEYVLVHELAHLLERGHTDRFRAILDKHLPDWRRRRNLLNGRNQPEA
jgi:predicted metal-dependent hydrolase